MTIQEIHDRLEKKFGPKVTGRNFEVLDPWIEIQAESLIEVARFLRDQPDLDFDMLHCVTAVDYFQPDPKKAAQAPWQPHLELIYHLSSFTHRHRLVLKTSLPRWQDGVEGELPRIASLSDLWSTAEWHEREVFDLMGIFFTGNADLRRILCPQDWVGHPLRKDYQMPEEYQGIRMRD
ncbi:MAG: NADH-quinone oxidoreductase subunit C [Pirellulales bacterium]|nr:NADH-quinone oxidoreductase subunit C [Pirellulales bacterium]